MTTAIEIKLMAQFCYMAGLGSAYLECGKMSKEEADDVGASIMAGRMAEVFKDGEIPPKFKAMMEGIQELMEGLIREGRRRK